MLDLIKNTVLEAGAITLEGQKRLAPGSIHTKGANPHDLVTDVDRTVERFLRDKLLASFPDYGFFGEEYGQTNADAEYRWVIDPIDGTTSFVRQTAYFSISVALQKNRKTVFGIVYAPKLGEFFHAESGKGAFLNGERIGVSDIPFRNSVCATGFACLRARQTHNNIPNLVKILPQIMGLRRGGSAALDLAYVAAGRYDGFWEMSLNLYDVAAGALLVSEAGGVVSDFDGGDSYPERGIAATNGQIHAELLKNLRE